MHFSPNLIKRPFAREVAMHRRRFLAAGSATGFAAAMAGSALAQEAVRPGFSHDPGITVDQPLIAPAGRRIRVAFAINPGVQVIDLAGPWETFQDTFIRKGSEPDAEVESAFELYTVSESKAVLAGSGGLKIAPDFALRDAPQPDVLVVPHFGVETGPASAIHEWIKSAHPNTALTMTICTGAFQLAKTGLLDGLPVTTNQRAYNLFARTFPKVELKRGPRFVETGRFATAGGLSAGIDLALRVVARYFDDAQAQRIADVMEYAGSGWRR